MVKTFLKKLGVFAGIGLLVLPAPFVHASTVLPISGETLLRNIVTAKSVDFSMDVDMVTSSTGMKQPVKVYIDFDVASSAAQESRVDMGMWFTDQNGKENMFDGSVIFAKNAVYFSEDGQDWYVAEQQRVIDVPTAAEVEKEITQIQDVFEDMMRYGVVEYRLESVEFLNKKPVVQYTYTVNTDRFVDYLVSEKLIDADEATATRTKLQSTVTIGGSVWIDTMSDLPTMFTMHVHAQQNATSYTSVNVSVVFNSFNAPVNIDIPKNATNIDEYVIAKNDAEVMKNFGATLESMDNDGDGVTNHDEEMVWRTNPFSADTDGDGYVDNTEIVNGYNPNGSGKLDSDSDGLTDYTELTIHWTNRFDSDSDNDGYNDGLEIANGYNPNGPGRW
jgi:hypothetical protein